MLIFVFGHYFSIGLEYKLYIATVCHFYCKNFANRMTGNVNRNQIFRMCVLKLIIFMIIDFHYSSFDEQAIH